MYGIWSILPPILAIVLAIWSKRLLVSLAAGAYMAALLVNHGNPFLGVSQLLTWIQENMGGEL
jgi:Na+/H+ antiporter NhaC